MFYNICLRFLTLTLITMLVGACATGPRTSVDKVERADDIPNAPYGTVLVVGVARNPDNARRFETALAALAVSWVAVVSGGVDCSGTGSGADASGDALRGTRVGGRASDPSYAAR